MLPPPPRPYNSIPFPFLQREERVACGVCVCNINQATYSGAVPQHPPDGLSCSCSQVPGSS